jgi:molecular chaperone GrpE (heat shock protein)
MCFCSKQKEIDIQRNIIKELEEEVRKYKNYYYEKSSIYDNFRRNSDKQLQEQYNKYQELEQFSKKIASKLMKYKLFDVNEMINKE